MTLDTMIELLLAVHAIMWGGYRIPPTVAWDVERDAVPRLADA